MRACREDPRAPGGNMTSAEDLSVAGEGDAVPTGRPQGLDDVLPARLRGVEVVTSSDPDSDTSDNPTDQSSDSLARSPAVGPSERAPHTAPALQALNARVRLPMSVRLPTAPGSSHDSTQDSAQESAQDSAQESTRDSTQDSNEDSAQDSVTASDSDSKGTASGGSLTYVTPDEYIRHIYPRPARTRSSHRRRSREVSYSSESPELYFQKVRMYGRRSYGGLCLSMSIVAVIVAVIGIVSVAAYLGVVTKEDEKALQYEMQYSGQFRVLSGDFYHPRLEDTQSNDFKAKAASYQRMLDALYGASYISEAFRHTEVHAFDGRPLTVFFRIHLDRRKIPKSVLNTEEALRDVLTQEVMAIQPKAFRALQLDINSIRISREKSWLGASPVLGGDNRPVLTSAGEDSTQPATATTPRRTGSGVALPALDGVRSGAVGDVYQLEDWVAPARVGAVSLAGLGPGDGVAGTEPAPGRPGRRGRPITEYQPSEYGDFPPALVGEEMDLASAATVESHHWRTNGVRGTGRPDVEVWIEGRTRHRQTDRRGQGEATTPGGPQAAPRPHHRLRPDGDSVGVGVMTPPDGVDRVRPADGGSAPPPPPPDVVPFVDRPSLQSPEYDRTPWQPVLPSRNQPTSGQGVPSVSSPVLPSRLQPTSGQGVPSVSSPTLPESAVTQVSTVPEGQGQGSVWPGEVTDYPERPHRGPGPVPLLQEEPGPPVADPSAFQTQTEQPRPGGLETSLEAAPPVAFWPRPAPPKFQRPRRPTRPVQQNTPSVASFLPTADKLGTGLLQMLSEFVLARTKADVLSRTDPTGQTATEQTETETEQSQSGTEQPPSETEQSESGLSQSSDNNDQMDTEEMVTLPPLTVVLRPAPGKSEDTQLGADLLIKTQDRVEETVTDIQPGTTEGDMKPAKQPTSEEESSGTSAVPDIIITFSAVNSTASHTKKISAQPPVYFPDKLVRKTLKIVSQNVTGDSPYVTHPSGIISKSPLGSSDLLDLSMPSTTASPSEDGDHAGGSGSVEQVIRAADRASTGQLGLTKDGELVTTTREVSLQTVPPHLHYRVRAGGLPAEPPTPAGVVQAAGAAPVVLSSPDANLPKEEDVTTVTVTPEQDWERNGHVTKPFFQPVTSYSGVYPPSRPKPPSLPHPEYPSTAYFDPDPSSSSSPATAEGPDGDEDYYYYDTEIFTEKNSVQSIFDMFSTRKPLVLDTDVVTSTSVKEQQEETPERRLILGLLRGSSRRRQGSGRSRGSSRRTKVAAAGKESKEFQLKERNNGSMVVSIDEAINDVNVSSPNQRKKRSPSWFQMNSPSEHQVELQEPLAESLSHRHAARDLSHSSRRPISSRPVSPEPAGHVGADDAPVASSLAARRVRRPSYSSQAVASLAARLRLAATPTARPRRGSRLRLPPRREKLADKLMRFRGVRSRGIFATTARPERRWRVEGSTRLPNSAPIHVVKYHEGATVDDILDRIFETRREFESSKVNEVGSSEGAENESASTTTSSALWRTSDGGETWQDSEKTHRWSPVKDSVPLSASEGFAASGGVDRIGEAAPQSSPSSHSELRLSANRLHGKDETQATNVGREDDVQPARPTIRPHVRLTVRPVLHTSSQSSSRPPVRSPVRSSSRPASRPTSRPTIPPFTTRPTSSRPIHKWRPVRFRLPTESDWPAATEPPLLADKLSRLTTTSAPAAAVPARPAPVVASDTQLVADTDNEVGTAVRPTAVTPTRPTLASLLSNYTYLEEGLTPPGAGCAGDQFRCVSGGCVPRLSRCDLLQDCSDGSDELACTCADRLQAQFLERKICDGIIDCHDNTDEQFCDWCRPGQFICPGAKRCVPPESVCDGKHDCADGADEHQCVTLAATRGAAGQTRYRPSGFLMVRRHGRWGPLCVDNFDALVRRTRTAWSVRELGRAVCSALTYNETTDVVRTESSPASRKRRQRQRKRPADPFYQLVLSVDAPNNQTDDTSLVFEEASCPRQTSVHITCDSLKCGLRPRVKQRQARIVGGANSSPGAWPWQAAMYRDGEYQCGATLISDRWLLSAGHCFLRSASNHWVARLGAYRRGSTLLSPFESLHQVSHIIVHPDYQDVGYVHDIALLRLADTVSMSDFVRPVCLPPHRVEVTEGALCSVVGWGQLFESGRIFPDTLQEVELPLITSQQCKKRTSHLPLYKITDDMFCAGYDRGGRDACLGDSGGPLMCQEPSGEWTLTGITSNGYGCARALRPGVYTKVANYVDWIERVTTGPLPRARRTRCRGHRCPLGSCLKQDSICDGVVDCADGSDEQQCSPAA